MVDGWRYISMEPCYSCGLVCPGTRKLAIALVLRHNWYWDHWSGLVQHSAVGLSGRLYKLIPEEILFLMPVIVTQDNNMSFSRLVNHTYASTLTTIWLKSVTQAHTLPLQVLWYDVLSSYSVISVCNKFIVLWTLVDQLWKWGEEGFTLLNTV